MLKKSLLFVLVLLLAIKMNAQKVTKSFDWQQYLSKQDIIWEQLPPTWNAGGFTGNGQLGMVMYASLDSNTFDFHIGRVDVTDHRKAPDKKTSVWVSGASQFYDYERLDIGRMKLVPAGKIISGTMRQDLWNAKVTANVVTDLGTITIEAFTHTSDMVNCMKVVSTEKSKDGSPANYSWRFVPSDAIASRRFVVPNEKGGKDYVHNPNFVLGTDGDISLCTQPLLAGGEYVTAWHEKKQGNQSSTLFLTVANEIPAVGQSAKVAANTIRKIEQKNWADFFNVHTAWWHNFYPKSFLSIPDAYTESFFWIQMYKLGSLTRENGELIDDQGPFFRINQWPYPTFNLNVQLSYWPVYASNHLELATSLTKHVDEKFPLMLKSSNNGRLGDLAWMMHNYWWAVRFNADNNALLQNWYPKAVAVTDCYMKMMKIGDDGKYHLPPMLSPEFSHLQGSQSFEDATYNIGLFNWLLTRLIDISELNKMGLENVDKWKEAKSKLVPFHTDENGLMIGKNQSFDFSHRHFSHLLPLYPLFVLNPDNNEDRELVEKSLKHWHHIENGLRLAGYSFTGAASLYAALGQGDTANKILHGFLKAVNAKTPHLTPNTFYMESGGKNPTIETPLNAASAIMDFLLQSWGNKIRVFPATPSDWKDAVFQNLTAIGGFEVSAKRVNGKTDWVSIKSNAGEKCIIKVLDWKLPLASSISGLSIKELGKGEYELGLKKGQTVFVYPKGSKPDFAITPVKSTIDSNNGWGFKNGMKMPDNEFWPEKLN